MGLLTGGREGRDGAGRGRRVWAAYASCILVAGLIASHSRSGFLGMLAGLAVVGAPLLPRASRVGARRAGLVLVAILGVIGAILLAAGASTALPRLASLVTPESYADRLEVWQYSIRAWRTSPWLGLGLGGFQVSLAPFFRRDWGVIFVRAENEYLDLLVEGGAVGLGLALVGAACVARLAVYALSAARPPCDRAAVLGALSGLTAIAVQSLGDFCLHIPAIALPVLVIAARLSRMGWDASPRPDRAEAPRWRPALVGLATVVVALMAVSRDERLAYAEALANAAGTPASDSAQGAGGRTRRRSGH